MGADSAWRLNENAWLAQTATHVIKEIVANPRREPLKLMNTSCPALIEREPSTFDTDYLAEGVHYFD
jgi:hypothetical protein